LALLSIAFGSIGQTDSFTRFIAGCLAGTQGYAP
jgi:hypothetical protein